MYFDRYLPLSSFSSFLPPSLSITYSQICTLRQSKELENAYVPQQLSKPTSSMSTGPGFTLTDVFSKEILSLSLPVK